MENGSGLEKSAIRPEASSAPNLLIELEPWRRVFFRNLADLLLFRRAREIELTSSSGAFWPDVFVSTRVSWRSFLESVLYHSLIIAGLWGFSQSWRQRPVAVHRHVFDKASVIYYPTSEYLPPLNTGHTPARQQKGEPEYAKQPIISVPPEPDNRTQTIVTPPDLKIDHDVPLPNIVAWAPTQMSVPLAATTRSAAQITLPNLPVAVVAPPPELSRAVDRGAPALPASVIPPPPSSLHLISTRLLSAKLATSISATVRSSRQRRNYLFLSNTPWARGCRVSAAREGRSCLLHHRSQEQGHRT